jgi:hypothetical protein
MPDFTGDWTGLFWGGTQQGIVSATFTVVNNKVSGKLKFLEQIGDYEADLIGTVVNNRLTADLKNFHSQNVTGLSQSGKFQAILSGARLEGEWLTDLGNSGKATLFRFIPSPQQPQAAPVVQPSALITKTLNLGCYRLDKTELLNVVKAVHDGTKVPEPLVGVTWNDHTVSRLGVQAIVEDADIPSVVRNLSVIVNEYNLNLGGKSIYLYLKDKDQSTLVVNGNEQIWVDGKVEQIKRALSHAEVKAVGYVRKYGPELNGLIFLALLAFLPSVDSVSHRGQIVVVTFVLLLLLLYAWRLPSNTKVFIREPKPSWWQKHGSAFLLGLMSVCLSGLITFLIKKYVH